jgi:hypothetical protein
VFDEPLGAELSFVFRQEYFVVVVESKDPVCSLSAIDQIVERGKRRDPRLRRVVSQRFEELDVEIMDVSLVFFWKLCDANPMNRRILL